MYKVTVNALTLFLFMGCMACSQDTKSKKKYIDDTIVHEADSPVIHDKSMVPAPDTTDRNLDNPNTKIPDKRLEL